MNYLLGIDIGTTSVKTLLITTEGEIVNSSVI
jgi:sugar (pentulose or hexulose) kinase